MSSLEKNLREEKRWQGMIRRGHPLELVLNASIWVGSYIAVRLVHVGCFKIGWASSPGTTSWDDVVIAAVTGLTVGEIDWSGLKRKFSNPPPEE